MRPFAPEIFTEMERALNTELFRVPLVVRCFRDEGEDRDGPLRVEYEKLCSPAYLDKAKKTYFYVECDLETGNPVRKKDGTWSVKVTGGQGESGLASACLPRRLSLASSAQGRSATTPPSSPHWRRTTRRRWWRTRTCP